MGCNTSKESVPQAEEENKDAKDQVIEKGAGENHIETKEGGQLDEEEDEEKSASAKTVTLRSNGTSRSAESRAGSRPASSGKGAAAAAALPSAEAAGERRASAASASANEDQAATKIQAAFRGHQTRQSMKQANEKPTAHNHEPEPTQQELEAEFREDDVELTHAATKIQASFRGHMSRKQMEKEGKPVAGGKEDKLPDEEELDIDLSDPNLNKAAVKIQASFRGHMVRKDNEEN